MDIKITSKNTENNLKQILAKTDFLNYEQYLEARTAADLKLLKQNEEAIYEKVLDRMPACWYLFKDEFIYMEDLASNKITVVRLARGELKPQTKSGG